MKREFLIAFSAAALLFFCSPLTHAQSQNAQSTSTNGNSSARAQEEASQMVPAHATLEQTVDAKDYHAGEQLRARLGEDVQLKNGPNLPNGTVLIGEVSAVSTQAGSSRLALRFTQARLNNGATVPIKAMIVAIEAASLPPVDGESSAVPTRDLWNSHVYRVDQVRAVSGADLHSSITSRDSAVIVSPKKNDVKIGEGSRIDLALAEQSKGNAQGRPGSPTM